jgi:hypothetical protein
MTCFQSVGTFDISRKEARKRLLMIARKTEQVPAHRFNFEFYVGNDWLGDPNLSCGTQGCAVGWGTTIPYLRKLGLHLVKNPYDGIFVAAANITEMDNNQSAARFFGLSIREYEYVFVPYGGLDGDATNQQVADHIRRFVDWRFPEFAKHPTWPVQKGKK